MREPPTTSPQHLGLLGFTLSLAAALITAHHPAALPLFGFLVGAAQWSDFRRVGLGASWIGATGFGWLAALLAMALIGRGEAVIVTGLAVVAGGVVLGVAQQLAARRAGWARVTPLFTAGGVAISWALVLILDQHGARLPLGAPSESLSAGGRNLATHYLATLGAGLPLAALGVVGLRRGAPGPRRDPRLVSLVPLLFIALVAGVVWQLQTPQPMNDPAPRPPFEPKPGVETPWFSEDGVKATIHQFEVADEIPLFAYHLRPADQPTRALVVFVPGSGGRSVQGFARRKLAPLVRDWGVAVATLDSPGVSPSEGSSPEPSAVFYAYDDKQVRVACAQAWLDQVVEREGPFTQIGLIGYSEGVDVVAQLARDDPRIDAAVLLGGGGYNAADEIRVGLHEQLRTGSSAIDSVVQRAVDLYVWRHARRVLANPSVDRRLLGLTFRRWSSYIVSAPIDDLLAAEHARFLSIHGDRDTNVPVEAARYIGRPFHAAGRTDHTLEVRPGLDHSFRDREGHDHLGDVLATAVRWILAGSRR